MASHIVQDGTSGGSSAQALSSWGGTPSQAAARFTICIPYIVSALQKFQTFDKATGGPLSAVMASKADILLQHVYQLTTYDIRVPAELYPRLFLTSAVAEFMGALLFISDQRFGCWVLLWYTILNTALMHNFWDAKDTAAVQANWTLALKNVSIVGGFIYYLATSQGTRHQRPRRQSMEVGASRAAATAPTAAEAAVQDTSYKKSGR